MSTVVLCDVTVSVKVIVTFSLGARVFESIEIALPKFGVVAERSVVFIIRFLSVLKFSIVMEITIALAVFLKFKLLFQEASAVELGVDEAA